MLSEEFESRFTVTLSQDIIWGDMDAFQHVNNKVYFRYFEDVRIEHFERAGINLLMQQSKIGPILGATECKFLVPLDYPDSIIIGSNITRIREKRFTMGYEVFSKKLADVVAIGSGEIVYYDYNIKRSCAVPESILKAIDAIGR